MDEGDEQETRFSGLLPATEKGKKVLHSLYDICLVIVVVHLDGYKKFPVNLPFPVRQTLIEMSIAKRTLTDNTLGLFLHPSTMHLDLSGTTTITDEGINAIRDTCPNLKHLSLSRCTNVTPSALLQLFCRLANSKQDNEGLISIDLSRCIRVNDSVISEGLASCFRHVQAVNLSRCSQIKDSSVLALLDSCKESLREINLFGCNKLTNAIWVPLSRCTNLRRLILSRCFLLSDDAARGQLANLLNNCKNLEILNLARLKGIHDSALKQIASASCSSSLIFLDVTSSTTLTNETVQAWASGCTSLQTLYLSNVQTLTDETICEIASQCTNLKLLYLSSLQRIGDPSILEIAKHLKQLQTLNISRCALVTDASVLELARNCRKLTTVYLSHCTLLTGKVLHLLRKKCPNLTSLDVSACSASMTDSSFHAIENIARMKNMKILDLSQSKNLSLEDMRLLGDNLYKLTLLALTETNISNEGLRILAHGYLPSLNWLSLCTCPGVTDLSVVHELLDNLPSLSKLYISGCPFTDEEEEGEEEREKERSEHQEERASTAVEHFFFSGCPSASDRMMRRLIVRMPNLQTLALSQCTRLTDATFCLAADECKQLQHLGLADCANITDAAIKKIAEQIGPNDLLSVTISHCTAITDGGFFTLLQHSKHLQSLFCSGSADSWPDSLLLQVHSLCPSLMMLVIGLTKNKRESARQANHPSSLEIS